MPHDSFRRSQVAIGALFCFLGFQYGTWVARVPAFRGRWDLDESQVGLLLLAPGLGAVVSAPLIAWLMRRLGSQLLAGVSMLGLLGVLAGLVAAPGFATAAVILFLDGVLIACLNVAMNAQGAALEVRYERNTMALLHAVFSAGTFAAALLASAVTAVTGSLGVQFALAGALLLGLAALARTGTLPDSDAPAAAPEPKARRRWVVTSWVAVGLSVAMALGELAEGAMNEWSALYLHDAVRAPDSLTPLGVAAVAAMMVLGRLFADGWRERWGDKPVVVAGTLLAATGLGAALLLGGVVATLIGFAAVGLGMAAVTPCIYVAASRLGPNTLATVAAMGTIGLLAGPPAIGFLARGHGIEAGMGAVVAATALIAVCVLLIRWPTPARAELVSPRTSDVT